jgi:diguanylate cyclase (GGDEF)-like protein
LEFLTDFLKSAGHELLCAADGVTALQIFSEQAPRIVISDWILPGMDGLELCRRIRATESGKYVHFIMLTERTEKANVAEAFEAGVDDYIGKPFDRSELLGRLRAGLRSAWLHDELARKNEESWEVNSQLARLNESLQKAATTDELTGLPNRRMAITRLEEQIALADRYAGPLAVAIVDIDRFKQVNDTFGHDAGDMVLRHVAAHLQANVRPTDTVGRIGGEEFLMIFPAQTAQEAAHCAEHCRAAVASQRFTFGTQQVGVTISIGVAARRTQTIERSELLKEADRALYAAKTAGRNAVNLGGSNLAASADSAPDPLRKLAS